MKYIVALIIGLGVACTAFAATGGISLVSSMTHGNQTVNKYVDQDNGATCYVVNDTNGVSISCLQVVTPQPPCHPTPQFKGC